MKKYLVIGLLCCCTVPPSPTLKPARLSIQSSGGCVEKTLRGLPYPDGTIVVLIDPSKVPLQQVVRNGEVTACLFGVSEETGTVQVGRLGSSESAQVFWTTKAVTTTGSGKRRIVGR